MKQSPERQSTHKVICSVCKKPNRFSVKTGSTHYTCKRKRKNTWA